MRIITPTYQDWITDNVCKAMKDLLNSYCYEQRHELAVSKKERDWIQSKVLGFGEPRCWVQNKP